VWVGCGGVIGVVFVFSVFASAAGGHGPCWEGVGLERSERIWVSRPSSSPIRT